MPVTQGMNEFWLIISENERRPAHDLIVSIRAGESGPWRQMIQDGHTGVYRRAVAVQDPESQALEVQIKRGAEVGRLHFPLRVSEGQTTGS